MNAPELSIVLDRFAAANSTAELEECAAGLLKAKLVNKVRDDERFRRGMAQCFKIETPDADRLKAIAIAYRLGATSKPVMRAVKPFAAPALAKELPPLDLLPSGEDRYYASLSIMDAEGTWVSQFAANGIASEETAETARETLAMRLFGDLPVADALSLLAASLARVTFATDKPSESAAKRLRRVIAAVRPALVAKAIPPGRDIGRSLRQLFESPFTKLKPPPEGKVAQELGSACCNLVHDILRTQLSVVAEPDVYHAIQVVRSWVTPVLWPRFVRTDGGVTRVRAALENAILLLAKQRVTDQHLLDALVLFFPSREEAAARTAEIAKQNAGLDSEVREWLSRFGRSRATPVLSSMVEARESNSDAAIAALLVLAESLKAMLGAVQSAGKQEGAALPSRLLRDVDGLTSDIVRLASSRQMYVRLKPGEIVEYSQNAHELVGGAQLGVRKVSVVQPLVERRGADGVAAIIQKAIVAAPVETVDER